MTRFINTTLTALVSFFVFLAVLWLFVDPAAPGLSAQDDRPTAVTVKSTKAAWDAGDASGRRVNVELLLSNDGAAATVTQVAYRATLDGQLLAANSEDPPIALPAGADAPVRFTVTLPEDFAARWWSAYRQQDEALALRIDGSVAVRMAAGDHRIPFAWTSSWHGRLLDSLAASTQECPGPPAPLCLADLDAGWESGRLATTITLRNDQSEPVVVRNGTFRLVFEGVTVATGRFGGGLNVPAGEEADLEAHLAFDDAAVAQWWPGHASRCETSRLSFNVGLEVDGVDAGTRQVDWDMLAAPYETGFLCKGSA